MLNIDKTPSCNITDCLNNLMGRLSLSYDQLERMAFNEGVYPAGYEPFFEASDADESNKPVSNAIRALMREQGIVEMYLTEND